MKHFIVATHGYFSREIINSAALILGGGLDILSLCMCETTTGDDIRAALWQKLDSCAPDDDVIIMADVLGGAFAPSVRNSWRIPVSISWPASTCPCF